MAFSVPAGLCGSCSPFSLSPLPSGCSFSPKGLFCSPHISSPVLPVLQFVGARIKPEQRLPWDKVTLKVAQKGKVKTKVISYINLDPNKDLLVSEAVPWAQSCRQQEVSSSRDKNFCLCLEIFYAFIFLILLCKH